MTTNTATATNGHTSPAVKGKSARGSKPARRSATSRPKAKRTAKPAGSVTGSYSASASRLLSRGTKAAGSAYEWAAEGAGRAAPLAARHMPDQRTIQRLVDDRPYVLGAIGLGIGTMIGLMLPARLLGGTVVAQPRATKRARAKR